MFKELFAIIISSTLIFSLIPTTPVTANIPSDYIINVESDEIQVTYEMLEDGSYYETTLHIEPESTIATFSTTESKSASKTTAYKDATGKTLWSVTVNATFSYNSSSSNCTSCSHSTSVSAASWAISTVSSRKSGNSATASATAIHSNSAGATKAYSRSVTITCSATGVIS